MKTFRHCLFLAVLAAMALIVGGGCASCCGGKHASHKKPKPVIVVQPVDVAVTNGATAQFFVSVSPPDGLLYRWQRNGTNVTGPTNNPILTIPDASLSDVALYRCLISREFSPWTPLLKSDSAGLYFIAASTNSGGGTIVPVTGPFTRKSYSGSGCPGSYVGYVKFFYTDGSVWWPQPVLVPAATKVTLVDTTTYAPPYDSRTVIVENLKPASPLCGPRTGVTWNSLTPAAKYSFTIYVKSGAPPAGSPITANIIWEP